MPSSLMERASEKIAEAPLHVGAAGSILCAAASYLAMECSRSTSAPLCMGEVEASTVNTSSCSNSEGSSKYATPLLVDIA